MGIQARADTAMMPVGFTSATRLPFVLVMGGYGGSKTRSALANASHLKEFQGGAWAALHNYDLGDGVGLQFFGGLLNPCQNPDVKQV